MIKIQMFNQFIFYPSLRSRSNISNSSSTCIWRARGSARKRGEGEVSLSSAVSGGSHRPAVHHQLLYEASDMYCRPPGSLPDMGGTTGMMVFSRIREIVCCAQYKYKPTDLTVYALLHIENASPP